MGEGGEGFKFLYASVSEPPCNGRIFHACHRLYHVPFIPCCRWRVSTSGCCVLHHCVFTFSHIPRRRLAQQAQRELRSSAAVASSCPKGGAGKPDARALDPEAGGGIAFS